MESFENIQECSTIPCRMIKEDSVDFNIEYLEEAEEEISEVVIEEVTEAYDYNEDDTSQGVTIEELNSRSGETFKGKRYVKCEICHAICSKTYIQRHRKKHINPLKCPICDSVFSLNHHRIAHIRRHHPEYVGDYECETEVKIEVEQEEELTVVTELQEKKPEPLSITCCGEDFPSFSILLAHMEQFHPVHLRDGVTEHRGLLLDIIHSQVSGSTEEVIYEDEEMIDQDDLMDKIVVGQVEAYENQDTMDVDLTQTEDIEPTETVLDGQEEEFICYLCGSRRANKEQLRRHMKKHRLGYTGEPDVNACRHCGFATKDCDEFKEHLSEYHQKLPQRAECEFCDKSFVTKYSILLHYRVRHSEQNFDIPDFVRSDRTTNQNAESKSGKFKCYECKKYYDTKEERKECLNSHEDQQHMCAYCAKIFSNKKSLNHHVYLKHTHREKYESRDFICPECGVGFNTEYNLKTHRGNVHGVGEINFKCSHCGKGFFRQIEYDKHQIVHSNVRPYNCDYPDCARSFKSESSLRMHQQNIHESKEEDKTKCLLCEGIFKNHRVMRSHVRKVHKMSLAQAHETIGLPYNGRPMWNSIERKKEICVNNRLYPVPNVKILKDE